MTGPKAGAHWFQQRTIRPNLGMALHADLSCRHSRESRSFDSRMAITTVNVGAGYMMLMTERNRLRLRDADICYVSRTANRDGYPRECCNHKNEAEYDYARNNICPRMKYSGHLSVRQTDSEGRDRERLNLTNTHMRLGTPSYGGINHHRCVLLLEQIKS